jgi:hypothetical protein
LRLGRTVIYPDGVVDFLRGTALSDAMRTLIQRWREDPNATYRSWFLWEERVKNFRSIRRGIQQVVADIGAGTFGNAYRGSSLETVVHSIAEQRQIFKGADHAFLWKPKLRIPDIYENPDNQRAFGHLLDTCVCCNAEAQVLAAIRQIDTRQIKGLGPAVANLLYFLHPTIVPPFNTAIVNGYNALTGAKVKLGRWDEFLAMRQGILGLRRGPGTRNRVGHSHGLRDRTQGRPFGTAGVHRLFPSRIAHGARSRRPLRRCLCPLVRKAHGGRCG